MSILQSIADRRIRDAQEAGRFDELPGRGRPIADLDRHRPAGWWIRRFVKSERDKDHADRFRARLDVELAALWRIPSVSEVRARTAEINEAIALRNRQTVHGPVAPLDPDDIVRRWRAVQRMLHGS